MVRLFVITAALLGVLFLAGLPVRAESPRADDASRFRPFDRSEYESGDFELTTHTYRHGRVKIQLTQAKRVGFRSGEPPCGCRGWLEVYEGKKWVWGKYFDDMAPAGFSYGLSVPLNQPSPDWFAVVKNGDADGRLFLIDKKGGVTELPGGFYFVTFDTRFLISEYVGDFQQVVVFDLITGVPVLDTRTADSSLLPGDIYDWYHDGARYYFTIARPGREANGGGREDRKSVYEIRVNPPGIVKKRGDFSRLHHKNWDFDPRLFKDCCSEPARKPDKQGGDEP